MDKLGISDWFGLISFLIAVLSIFFNYIQWRKQNELEKDVSQRTVSGMNAGYQALWRIAEICDRVREVRNSNNNIQEIIPHTYEKIQEISGCADTGRAVMNSICRDLVGKRLYYEAPWIAQTIVMESKSINHQQADED